MFPRMLARKWTALVVLAAALALTACTTDTSNLESRLAGVEAAQAQTASQYATAAQLQQATNDLTRITEELEELHASLSKTGLIASLDMIDSKGFHSIDTEMQRATEIPPQLAGTIRNVRRTVIGTRWPEPVAQQAEAFKHALEEFEQALDANALAAAKAAAIEAHETQHALSDAAWPLVAGESPENAHGH
jgi:hypothetical protein